MKFFRLPAIAALALCTGCSSPDSPLSGFRLFQTGRDARTFNPQTGQYEWPSDAAPRPKSQTAPAARPATATPAPKSDGRYYDPQKGAFTDPSPAR